LQQSPSHAHPLCSFLRHRTEYTPECALEQVGARAAHQGFLLVASGARLDIALADLAYKNNNTSLSNNIVINL
jgi:hypothetical protein